MRIKCQKCNQFFEDDFQVCPHCGNIYEETTENISALAPEKESEVEVPNEEKLEKKNDEFFIIKNFKIEMDKLIKILVGIVAILLVIFIALLASGNGDSKEIDSPKVNRSAENEKESVEEPKEIDESTVATTAQTTVPATIVTTTQKVTTTAIPSLKDITNLKQIVDVFEGYCVTPCGFSTELNDSFLDEETGMTYERVIGFYSNAEVKAYVSKFVSDNLLAEYPVYEGIERNGKLYVPSSGMGFLGTDIDNARFDGVLSDGTYVVSALLCFDGASWSELSDISTYHFKKINGTFKLVGYKG